jgi:hypothetical protein
MIEIRASAIADFLDCGARAEARHLLGKRTPSSGKALLGTAIHASTAVFDRSTMEGAGITIDEAAAAAVDTIRHPNEDVDLDDDNVDQMESVAIALHGRYCREIAPKQEYAAVEVKCDRLEISDLGIALTGTTDRVYKGEEGYGIADLKSGGSAVRKDGHVETKGHAFQLGVYELLAQSASGVPISEPAQIVGMQTGKTEAGQRVGIGTVYGARDALLGDGETAGVLETVARMIQSGIFFGNPRSMMCGPKFCPIFNQCNFRK